MRVMYCWTHLSGYIAACWRELCTSPRIDVQFVAFDFEQTATVPFLKSSFADLPIHWINPKSMPSPSQLLDKLAWEKPDVIVVPGWAYEGYRNLTQALTSVPCVMTMDTPRRNWFHSFTIRRM